ncbi:MAG: hypothetical protein Q4E35_09250 [Eubacteriales bacterium]|nr:hypothetical protein [Eubacteriales bacterium]
MGVFSSMFAINKIQKIKNGGVEKLSISDIANCITNLPDARKNLSPHQFEQISNLFFEFNKCTTKMDMDMDAYLDTCLKIIKEYDAIAPYELYSGGNEIEFKFMMEDIRSQSKDNQKSIIEMLHFFADSSKYDYSSNIKNILEHFYGITYDTAKAFMGVVEISDLKGKEIALDYFDKLMDYELNKPFTGMESSPIHYVSYLCGALLPFGVVSKEESDAISKKYSAIAIERVMTSLNTQNNK